MNLDKCLVQGAALNQYSETKSEHDARIPDIAKATASYLAVNGDPFLLTPGSLISVMHSAS